jgi:antirestriction protein
MPRTKVSPQLYIASLADYNAGRLVGEWIDATLGLDHIEEEIQKMLATSKEPYAEEWAIHDYEGFGTYPVNEYDDLGELAELAEAIEQHGEVVGSYAAYMGDVPDALQYFEERYHGTWSSFQEYSDNYVEDTGMLHNVPDFVKRYFDYEAFARDLQHDFTVIEDSNGVHVFANY